MRDRRCRGVFCLSSLLSIALARPATAESSAEIAASLAAANRAALDGIRTFHAKMRGEGKMLGTFSVCEVECWRRGNDIRQKETTANQFTDRLRSARRQTSVGIHTQANGSKSVAAEVSPADGQHFGFDLWAAALCVVESPDVTLEKLLAGGHTLESAKYSGSGAKRKGHLRVRSSEKKWYVLTIDPSANHMLQKLEAHGIDDIAGKRFEHEVVSEVESFAEVAPGIFFPSKIRRRGSQNGRVVEETTETFSDVAVNRPLPDGVFTPRLPRGVSVTDRITNTSYQADDQGRPISAVKKLGVYAPPPPAPSELIPPTTSEADPWAWWP